MKILFCGDVNGRFEAVFKRVGKIEETNGPFSALLCCGRFYGTDNNNNPPSPPVPTYFMDNRGGLKDLQEGTEVVPGIHYLGQCGIQTILNTFTVAYCGSGVPIAQVEKKIGIASKRIGFLGVDALLTSEWPRGIEAQVDTTWLQEYGVLPHAIGGRAEALAAILCRPRYHIAGTHNIFWARLPYLLPNTHENRAAKCARFVALAHAAKSKEKMRKWLHAVDIDSLPFASLQVLHAIPPGTTESPYLEHDQISAIFGEEGEQKKSLEKILLLVQFQKKKKKDDSIDKEERIPTLFVGGLPPYINEEKLLQALTAAAEANDALPPNSVRLHNGIKGAYGFADFDSIKIAATTLSALRSSGLDFDGRKPTFDWGHHFSNNSKSYPEDNRSECWFCLASPSCETHLVASVGDSAYLAMPKGPLLAEHALVIPVDHVAQTAACPDVLIYVQALARCHAAHSKKLTVAFERYAPATKKGVYHAHMHLIPVLTNLQHVIDAFKTQATHFRFQLSSQIITNEQKQFHTQLPEDVPFFRLYVFDGQSETPRASLMNIGDKVPLHFGRQVLAHILNTPDKIHWKACELSQQEELSLCIRFKNTFAPFDPFVVASAPAASS